MTKPSSESVIRYSFSDDEIDSAFRRLDAALKTLGQRITMRDNRGHAFVAATYYRPAKADDFMLMHQEGEVLAFKSRVTRNYVFLHPDGRLEVPKTDKPFMRGEF